MILRRKSGDTSNSHLRIFLSIIYPSSVYDIYIIDTMIDTQDS